MKMYVFTYPSPLPWVGYDTIFKWSKADFNWEYYFSWNGCLTKPKEPVCLTIYS